MLQMLWGPSGLILLGAFLSAIGALWASQQQGEFERHLREKSEEIAQLNREVVNLVTGGKSFCYMAVSSINPQSNIGLLTFVHSGEHPMFNVAARIVDLEEFDKLKDHINIHNFQQADINIGIGDFAKNAALVRGPFPLGKGDKRNFNIFFSARNGWFDQLLRFRKINGQWVQATRVERDGEVLYERIDDNYPRAKDGGIDWNAS